MNSFKRIASIMLALVLAMALTVPAFAQTVTKTDGDGSITVENAAVGAKYNFYKLFDATNYMVGTDSKSISYTYNSKELPSGLETFFKVGAEIETGKWQITALPAAGSNGQASPALVTALAAWAKTATPTYADVVPEADSGAFKIDGVAYGYYVMTSDVGNGAAVSVSSTAPDAEITEKNNFGTPVLPENAKTADKDSAAVGETVNYTLRVNAVNYVTNNGKQDKIYEYLIKDTMTPNVMSTPVVDSIELYELDKNGNVGETALETLTATAFDANGEIKINWTKDGNPANDHLYKNGVQIVVKYHATVLKAAEDGAVIHNTLTFGYNGEYVTGSSTKDVTVAKIVIDKYAGVDADNDGEIDDPTDTSLRLSGAEFKLMNATQDAYYHYNTTDNKVEWVAEADGDVVTTDDNGSASFKGLANGTYYLVETKAPEGYNKLTAPVTVTVAANATTQVTTQAIGNMTGTVLPETGGMGTTIFYTLGGLLVVGSAILFVTKKRVGSAD